jgi:uncharacterized protein involved in exopolysaccharide biosynthesis
MKLTHAAQLAAVKRQAATVLDSVATEHETLRQQCHALSASYADLEGRYIALEQRHANCEAIERHLRQEIAQLERPWYVRWFGLGDTP